jgi:peptide/nickel transport system substrate-binding protein
MKNQVWVRVLFFVACITCAFSSYSATFKWASQGDLQTLDPHAQNEVLTNSINGQVYETLLGRDKNLEIVAALAVEWQQTTATTWRLKLRPNVRFHDGSLLTAEDVIFSVQRAKEPTSAIRTFAAGLGDPKKFDDLTVDFFLPRVNPVFLEHATLVQIMSRAWCEANNATKPQDFKNNEIKYTTLNTNGTGPFMLVSRQPDVKTVYKRNTKWWGSFQGNVTEVIYTPIKSDSTRAAALLSGELQLLLDPAPQDVQRMRAAPDLNVLDGVENRVLFIGMDQGRDELLYSTLKGKNPFKDVRVRKALYQATDIEALKSKLMRGQSRPTGVLSPSPLGIGNDAELERRLPYDLAVARALLSAAGYADGFDVQLDCPNNRYINDEEICIALAGMWAQIGVKVKVNTMPRAVYFAKGEKLDVSMYLLGWGGSITDMEVTLTPVLRNRAEAGIGSFNWGNYKNPKLDALAAASSQEANPAKRADLIKAAMREHNEQVHHIPLHRQVIPWAMRKNVEALHRADNWLEWRWVTIK